MKNLNGGFSKGIVESYHWKKYISSPVVAGYIGTGDRTKERDKIVEEYLRATGLEYEGIACWLTSTDGRHLMDGVDRKTTKEEFIKIVKSYTNDAFRNVTIWSCPDHEGSLASTHKLHDKIFGKN